MDEKIYNKRDVNLKSVTLEQFVASSFGNAI